MYVNHSNMKDSKDRTTSKSAAEVLCNLSLSDDTTVTEYVDKLCIHQKISKI